MAASRRFQNGGQEQVRACTTWREGADKEGERGELEERGTGDSGKAVGRYRLPRCEKARQGKVK